MIKELRMYWRLRPYINQFKEVTQMGKFSVHMLFQIISVLIGALVSIFGFLPPEAAKPVLCACIILSAVYGLYAHFKNPDGTDAAEPWQQDLEKIKRSAGIGALMVLIAALFISAPGHAIAQDLQQSIPSNTALAGAVINSESTGNYQASLAFRKALSGPLATITFYDVSGVNLKQRDFTNMQYSARQALTARITQIKPWLGVWALGEFGVTGTQGVSTGSAFGAGGYADISFGKNHSVHAWIMPKVTKNTVQGSNFEMRFYVGPSW